MSDLRILLAIVFRPSQKRKLAGSPLDSCTPSSWQIKAVRPAYERMDCSGTNADWDSAACISTEALRVILVTDERVERDTSYGSDRGDLH